MGFRDLLTNVDRVVRQTVGDSIVYTSGTDVEVTVQGVFDAQFVRVDLGSPGVSSVGPAVFLRLSELPSNPGEDTEARISVDGVVYRMWEAKPDGLGGVHVLLHEVV